MDNKNGLLAGKKGLIMGVANNRSIAWGIAKAVANEGAELAFTYQGDALKKRVEPLANSVGSYISLNCDVTSDESMDEVFSKLKNEDLGILLFTSHLFILGSAFGFTKEI